jgi:type VI protein secretion system component Hcp
MSEPEQVEIDANDITSLAGKLETLFSGLDDKEQAILSHILLTAAESTSEVSGYSADGFTGFAPTLAVGVGFHDISFTRKVDKSSPTLFLKCANGEHFK